MNVSEVVGTDALTVRRVYGEPYEKNGVTIIPAAMVFGGGGGGGGASAGAPKSAGTNASRISSVPTWFPITRPSRSGSSR